jgi:chemotaxis protein CheZ
MPGLARLIEFHKEKSHIMRSVLEVSLKDGSNRQSDENGCTVLHDAIGQLRPDQMRRHSIPAAISELREIRSMTENSVETIMEKTEPLMDLEPALDNAMAIFEACGFQDIAGQRLAKVTELLVTLEERFHSLVHETGVADTTDALGDEELEIERRRKELILHGPQFTGDGVSQDEIDALLGA